MAERVWSEKDLVREGIERHSTPASWSARGRLRPPTSRSCAGSPSCGMTSTLNGRPSGSVAPPPHRGPGDRWFGVCAGGRPACPLQPHPVALRWPHSRCPRQRQHPIRPTGFRTMGLAQGKKVGTDSA